MKSAIKTIAKKILPRGFRKILRRTYTRNMDFFRGLRPPEQIFTEIYERNSWGGKPGEFNSGSGTSDQAVTDAYVKTVTDYITANNLVGLKFVDLGCGDFRVGRRLVKLSSSYIGVDVVRPLIDNLNEEHSSATIEFQQIDLARDALPSGDVCFIRQVMQHMSNKQIAKLLPKLAAYRCVFVTEHHPRDADLSVSNRDKTCGSTIRLAQNSGVYLTEPPFSIPSSELKLILEIPGVTNEGPNKGLIRTFAYRPQQ